VEKKVRLLSRSFDLTPLEDAEQIAFKDALVQLVRNAAAHGIELPEQRLAAGKEETGTVTVATLHRPGRVELIVEDDGAGLNLEAIRRRGISQGLITPDAARSMSDDALTELIFLSGFSTAEQVSMAAGRGVGMDIVRNRLRELGGDIAVSTLPGQGSRFVIHIDRSLDA
jgi:two-component system chemotaxis sensor kinase CheA